GAVAEKKFHIYAISHVDQGIELLTNLAAGEMRPDGTFTPGSFHALVDRQLAKWARLAERTGGAGRIAGTKSVKRLRKCQVYRSMKMSGMVPDRVYEIVRNVSPPVKGCR